MWAHSVAFRHHIVVRLGRILDLLPEILNRVDGVIVFSALPRRRTVTGGWTRRG
ncbi:hypothetical protein QNO09_34945 [Streptomyces sp. 378]|nr:hypothetical protein [Streptomyces sp. 378]